MFWCAGDGNWQHRQARTEFLYGQHVWCGPNAHETAVANLDNRAPSDTEFHAIGLRDQAAGWLDSSGQTFDELVLDFQQLEHWPSDQIEIHRFKNAGYARADVQAVIESCNAQNAVLIFQVGLASLLPHNEGYGLQSGQKGFIYEHFFTAVAYNSVTGNLLLCNGDREPHSDTPDWVALDAIMRAEPQAILKLTKGVTVSGVPSDWKDNGKDTLTAPNGFVVTQDMRKFVLAQPYWDSANMPLENKAYVGSIAHQTFLRCKLYYATNKGTYFGDVGQELLTALATPPPPPVIIKPDLTAQITQLHAVADQLQELSN